MQLNMSNEHIIANLQTILADVCSHRPAELGTFSQILQQRSPKSLRAEITAAKTAAADVCVLWLLVGDKYHIVFVYQSDR